MPDRNRLERKRIADFRRRRRPAGNFCADFHADRRDDVTLFAVRVFEQRQTRRTHRIIFNRRDRRFHAVLVALEIHEADFLLVPAADAARGHATVVSCGRRIFLRMSTSDFSGVVFVMSLKSAIVMYRVDGVSGLNVLTGIIAKVFFSNFEVGRPSFLFLWGISYRSANMLSCRPFGRRGARKLSDVK